MDNTYLHNKLSSLPEQMRSEISDFIEFLMLKAKKGNILLTLINPSLNLAVERNV